MPRTAKKPALRVVAGTANRRGVKAPDPIRERTQAPKNYARSASPRPKGKAKALLPRKAPKDRGLNEDGVNYYSRIEKQHRRWSNAPGCRAFLHEADVEAVVNAGLLYQKWMASHREFTRLEEGGVFDAVVFDKDGRALDRFIKAHNSLGYDGGQATGHIDPSFVEDEDSPDFA